MRKTFAFSLFILFFLFSVTSAEVISELLSSSSEKVEIGYFQDGKLVASKIITKKGESFVSGNIPNGLVKRYGADGSLLSTSTWKNNKLNGLARIFDVSGNVLIEDQWTNDQRLIKSKYFISDSILIQEAERKINNVNQAVYIIKGAKNSQEGVGVEYFFLSFKFGERNVYWQLEKQELLNIADIPYDKMTVTLLPSKEQVEIYFDISEFFGKL